MLKLEAQNVENTKIEMLNRAPLLSAAPAGGSMRGVAAAGTGGWWDRERKVGERGSLGLDIDPTTVIVCTNFKYLRSIGRCIGNPGAEAPNHGPEF